MYIPIIGTMRIGHVTLSTCYVIVTHLAVLALCTDNIVIGFCVLIQALEVLRGWIRHHPKYVTLLLLRINCYIYYSFTTTHFTWSRSSALRIVLVSVKFPFFVL